MQSQLCSAFQRLSLSCPLRQKAGLLSTITSHNLWQVRSVAGFFQKQPAHELWKSISVVSNAGLKRGRGRKSNFRVVKDLYKGKRVGDGVEKMLWPGLNHSSLKGRDVVQSEKLAEDHDQKSLEESKPIGPSKTARTHPLDRGYTSSTICGRSLIGSQLQLAEGFDFRALVENHVTHMNGVYGRVHGVYLVVACGNGDGVIGFGTGRGKLKMSAAQSAATKATRRLMHIERYKNHTVMHDFFSQYCATKLFVSKKPEGYGLVCHRVIATICKLVGIKDIHVKVEGSTLNYNIVKAFILGLVRQRKYEDMANEKQLYLVEFDQDARGYPNILASPNHCRTKDEIPSTESLDFKQHALDGKVVLRRPKFVPFYCRLPGWQQHLHRSEFKRGEREQMWEIRARHGVLKSYLTDKYSECVTPQYKWK